MSDTSISSAALPTTGGIPMLSEDALIEGLRDELDAPAKIVAAPHDSAEPAKIIAAAAPVAVVAEAVEIEHESVATVAIKDALEELADGPVTGLKFEFDAGFQNAIAALICRDTVFVQRIDGLVKPEYFENGLNSAWVSVALRYFAKYRRVPSDSTVYKRLITDDMKARVIDASYAPMMVKHWKEVLIKSDLSNRDFYADTVADFAKHQAVTVAITESVSMLERQEFDRIDKIVRRALDVGLNQDGDIYDYGKMITDRTGERLDRAAGKMPPSGITTGYADIDNNLYHKGWGRRELSLILGGAKAGKTTALIDFGIQALKAKYNVLYVTLEVAAKIIAERMDANITETPVNELESHVHSVRDKVQEFMAHAGSCKFVIKEFPTGSMRVSDLRRLIERYKAHGTNFDIVIVDYADLIAPERITESTIENSKSVYVNLRGLAMEQNIAILSATQTNRDGYKAAVAKAEHVADDFNKIRIADVVISINKTEEERASGQARLYFAACRNQAGGFSIRIEQRLDCMRFISKVVGFE